MSTSNIYSKLLLLSLSLSLTLTLSRLSNMSHNFTGETVSACQHSFDAPHHSFHFLCRHFMFLNYYVLGEHTVLLTHPKTKLK